MVDSPEELEGATLIEAAEEALPEVPAEAKSEVEGQIETEVEIVPEPAAASPAVKKTTGSDFKNIVQKGTEVADPRVRERLEDVRRSQISYPLSPAIQPPVEEQDYEEIEGAPTLLIISGSPRKHTCISLANIIEKGAHDSRVNTRRFYLHEKRISPCIGCNGCIETGICVLADAVDDDYKELKELIDTCDGIALVAPVYFSGPPAQLKALFDRFQPYWVDKYIRTGIFPDYRPSQLFVIGSGGDPHGYEPLVTISKSCLQIAGFSLDKVYNFIGYLAPSDSPKAITEEELPEMSKPDIANRKKAIIRQNEFRSLALEAGQAFGRLLRLNAEKANAEK